LESFARILGTVVAWGVSLGQSSLAAVIASASDSAATSVVVRVPNR